jgi:hypothetical protein
VLSEEVEEAALEVQHRPRRREHVAQREPREIDVVAEGEGWFVADPPMTCPFRSGGTPQPAYPGWPRGDGRELSEQADDFEQFKPFTPEEHYPSA